MTSIRHPHPAAGFSLVEMAIVLVIFALLAGGLMMTLTTQQEVQRLSEARRQLADIREALIGYAVANGRLPPPANPGIASGTAGAGEIDNTLTQGVIPWAGNRPMGAALYLSFAPDICRPHCQRNGSRLRPTGRHTSGSGTSQFRSLFQRQYHGY
jgi:prepilin-type N-terminal cleavage/methylation domain-containing protein